MEEETSESYDIYIIHTSYGSSTFEVLFDFFGVLSVITFGFLVELHVTFVDVIDVTFVIMLTTTVIFRTFLDPKAKVKLIDMCGLELVGYWVWYQPNPCSYKPSIGL